MRAFDCAVAGAVALLACDTTRAGDAVTLDEWRADTVVQGGLARVGDLIDRGDEFPERWFYPQAGSFVRFLLERDGPRPTEAVYPAPADGLRGALLAAFGVDADELEREYRRALGAAP